MCARNQAQRGSFPSPALARGGWHVASAANDMSGGAGHMRCRPCGPRPGDAELFLCRTRCKTTSCRAEMGPAMSRPGNPRPIFRCNCQTASPECAHAPLLPRRRASGPSRLPPQDTRGDDAPKGATGIKFALRLRPAGPGPDRAAFRRAIAAILGRGTVLPGQCVHSLWEPLRRDFARLCCPRPATQGRAPVVGPGR